LAGVGSDEAVPVPELDNVVPEEVVPALDDVTEDLKEVVPEPEGAEPDEIVIGGGEFAGIVNAGGVAEGTLAVITAVTADDIDDEAAGLTGLSSINIPSILVPTN
jgi:hypothetical protein